MKRAIREIGVEKCSSKLQEANIVFTTLNNAVDLLQWVAISMLLKRAKEKFLQINVQEWERGLFLATFWSEISKSMYFE